MEITVSLPEPEILSHEVDNDSFEYYDRKTGLFSRFDMGDYNDAQTNSKKEAEDKLKANEDYWKQARKNIETTLTNFMTASGKLDDYKIHFEWE